MNVQSQNDSENENAGLIYCKLRACTRAVSLHQAKTRPQQNVQHTRNQFFPQPTIAFDQNGSTVKPKENFPVPSQYMQPTQKIFRQPTIELDENGDMIRPNAVVSEMQEIPGKNIIINRHGKGKNFCLT